jgi:hypothetical protein
MSPVTEGSLLKSPSPRKKLGLAVTSLFRLLADVLTVRLPKSPEAAIEKLAEAAETCGIIAPKETAEESTDRINSAIGRAGTRLI